MIPEAFEQAHEFAGLITVFGFLAAFVLKLALGKRILSSQSLGDMDNETRTVT